MSIDEWKLASLASWNANARFWDNYIGSGGNDFVQLLEMPALEHLAGLRPGEYVLDLATGNGLVARRMAELGGIVTGTDASSAMLECAEARTAQGDHHRGVTYQILDVTNWEDLEAFVSSSTSQQTENQRRVFDLITMNMAIMDIASVEPLAAALPRLLSSKGRFVATILHPGFVGPGAARHIELAENQATGRFESKHSISVTRYLDIPPGKAEALPGQPHVQMLFHRPLHDLFRPFFRCGLVLDGLEEPSFHKDPDEENIQSYYNFPQIPPVLAFRLRLPSAN